MPFRKVLAHFIIAGGVVGAAIILLVSGVSVPPSSVPAIVQWWAHVGFILLMGLAFFGAFGIAFLLVGEDNP